MSDHPSPNDPGQRSCQPCTVCCVALPMPAGHIGAECKEAGVPCPHRGTAGCRIYANRPEACRRFECAWLADQAWLVAWRPDRSGLLCLREWIVGTYRAAAVYELRAGALRSDTGRAILAELQRTCTVIAVTDVDGNRCNLTPGDSLSPPPPRRAA